ncbi:MarR family winged helix-turn-helix transcriptional regulator [Candidatus Pelagibacter sp.]|nr:MarR family winged helix-turn-helix transcriptional regulator [Candidatus Pelagibacter sp.]
MEKIFNELYKNLHNSGYREKNPLKSFLFNTKQHSLLIFYIASQKNKKSTLEEICYNVSPKMISRSTIQNILKEGVKINFFEKEINENDKRAKYFRVTNSAIRLLEEWAYDQKEVFSSLKIYKDSK